MKKESFLRLLRLPKIVRLMKTGIDAVARRSMQIDADMEAPFLRFAHKCLDPIHFLLVDFQDLRRSDVPGPIETNVARIRNWQPNEIKSPIHDPIQLVITSASRTPGVGFCKVSQIKALPTGQRIAGLAFSLRRLQRVWPEDLHRCSG